MQAYTINQTTHQVLSIQYTYIHTGMWFARGFDKSGRTFCVRAHSTSSWGSFARCAHAASYSGIALKAADFMTFTKVSSEGYLHGKETYHFIDSAWCATFGVCTCHDARVHAQAVWHSKYSSVHAADWPVAISRTCNTADATAPAENACGTSRDSSKFHHSLLGRLPQGIWLDRGEVTAASASGNRSSGRARGTVPPTSDIV